MARAARSATANAIMIEDEVWQEAFETRVPSRRRRAGAAPAAAPDDGGQPVVYLRSAPTADPRPVRGGYIDLVDAPPEIEEPEPEPQVAELQPDAASVAQVPEAAPARRTIRIQGRGAERNLPWPDERSRRRPPRTLHERAGLRPDRVAMWAMFLGLLLVVVAALSGHG